MGCVLVTLSAPRWSTWWFIAQAVPVALILSTIYLVQKLPAWETTPKEGDD
jgi:hypothetical protein